MKRPTTGTGLHRYLMLTELFLPTKGGTAVWFDEVYRRIGDRSTHIVTASVPGDRSFDQTHPNSIHRVRLVPSRWLRPASLPVYAKLYLRGRLLCLLNEFDSVHAGRVLPEGLVALKISQAVGCPLIVYAHGEEITTWQRFPRRLRAMTEAYTRAARVIANSEFTRDELLKLGVEEHNISIVYPGVDLERFRPGLHTSDLRRQLGLGSDSRLLLSVGRLSRRKGFDQVIKSLSVLRAGGRDVHYALVGIGADRDYLERMAHETNHSGCVHFLGHVEADDLPRWYNAADVFVMPNREINGDTEGFGMVFLEAAACGKPSVAGRAGGTGAAVVDGQTGYRVNGKRTAEVAQALNALLNDDELSYAMGRRGLARARSTFDWPVVARRIEEITGGVLGTGGTKEA